MPDFGYVGKKNYADHIINRKCLITNVISRCETVSIGDDMMIE